MAYVAVSRGQWDAQIFTNDREKLSLALSHDVSHKSAYKPEQAIVSMQQKIAPSSAHGPEQGIGLGLGMWAELNLYWLAMAGASIKEIQEAAGHKTITMAAWYSHLSPAHKLSVVERIARAASPRITEQQ
jgi:hypothetical protein